jgi:hypothetical protein
MLLSARGCAIKEVAGAEARGTQDVEENEGQRRARELVEPLKELRVVLPGVQVLFAFLLAVPFAVRFAHLDVLRRDVFFATLLCTAAAAALPIAHSAHHRVLWRRGARVERLELANVLSILGLLFLVPAMLGVVFVISDLLFGGWLAAAWAVFMAGSFAGLWFGVPLWYRGYGTP